MDRWLKLLVVPFLVLLLCSGSAMATNITIWDGNPLDQTGSGDREDNEAEPGMVQTQIWDLEAFILEGSILTVIGGYDFFGGVEAQNDNRSGSDHYWTSGDIFIDLDKPVYGDIDGTTGVKTVNNTYGYDYAINIFDGNIYSIDGTTQVLTPYFSQNEGSSPWKLAEYESQSKAGTLTIEALGEGAIDIYVSKYSLLGWKDIDTHYGFSIDLGGLSWADQEFWAHFTMECGNDNMMGNSAAPVPEPATMLLLGTGLIGLAGASRKKFKK